MASIEAILSIGSNKEYLDGLVEQVRRGPGVTPFVGAGMSAQLDLLEWGEFLLATARRFFAEPEVRALLDAGKYEEAAEVCIGRSGPGGLQYSIGEEFGDQKFRAKRISAALRLIPDLVNGPVLTTNFDHVIERAFKEARKDFEQVVWGREADVMIDAFHQNRRYLFKIHGDVDRPKERILTREEYDKHYGQPGRTDGRGLALHRVIDLALSNRPLVFLGCSLKSDRIVGFLDDFYKQNERLTHYAILWRPVDDEQFRARGTALTRLGLKPIWYPYGDHDSIATILEHVLIRAGRTKGAQADDRRRADRSHRGAGSAGETETRRAVGVGGRRAAREALPGGRTCNRQGRVNVLSRMGRSLSTPRPGRRATVLAGRGA